MTVVKKYLSFRELKDRINNESFSKVVIDEKKSGKIEIYYSSKWIYADEVYIPRKISFGFDRRTQIFIFIV